MYKIVWLDVDGTLRDESLGIPETALRAITHLRKQNCLVMLCTGRMKSCITDDVLALPVDGIIAGGGCYLEYKGNIIENTFFPSAVGIKALTYLSTLEESAGAALETDSGVYMNETAVRILKKQNNKKRIPIPPMNMEFLEKAPEKIQYRNNLRELMEKSIQGQHINISKICLWSSHEIFAALKTILDSTDEHVFCLAQMETEPEAGGYYEIVQHGYDKGSAVKKMCSFLGLSPEHTIAFGDSGNDISMFKAVKTGIAMGNGCSHLKEVSDSVCEPLLENGLYKELKRRKLI